MFCHEQFKPYQLGVQFLNHVLRLVEKIPPGHSYLKDQLKRAATSIPLNIAEGTGKRTMADKLRFYSIARGSTSECAAICDVVMLIEPQLAKEAEGAKQILEEISKILTSMENKR